MICEPIIFELDDDGEWIFPQSLPLKTTVDVNNLKALWMKTERGKLIIEHIGRKAIYERIGLTPQGYWVCRLRIDPATVYGYVE